MGIVLWGMKRESRDSSGEMEATVSQHTSLAFQAQAPATAYDQPLHTGSMPKNAHSAQAGGHFLHCPSDWTTIVSACASACRKHVEGLLNPVLRQLVPQSWTPDVDHTQLQAYRQRL